MHAHAVSLRNTGELIKIYTGGAMKYYKQELEPMIELYNFRNKQIDLANKQESDLDSKKSKLLSRGDMSKWESDTELRELIGRSH